ncbi:MAG: hypothetical protein K6G65_06105 [Lachnospiraceae bacterium]|nr:hypothetical protein [Lachnospiraceae bacterium]
MVIKKLHLPGTRYQYIAGEYYLKMDGADATKCNELKRACLDKNIEILVGYFEKDEISLTREQLDGSFSSYALEIGDYTYHFPVLPYKQMNATNHLPKILGAAVYVMTIAGGEEGKEADKLRRDTLAVYLDMWEIALLDGARELLQKETKNYFGKEEKLFVSDQIGPGFYGMEVRALLDIAKQLDSEQIGVTIGNGMLSPAKSCGGIFLAFEGEKYTVSENPCAYCYAKETSCEFCNAKL